MKQQRITYSIEEPCQADWNEMKPENQGRFCSSCSKTVVDFSRMSDFSIVNYLENNKEQSVCGRFGEDQLAKSYLWTKPHVPGFSFDLKAVVLGLALSTFSALPSLAQVPVPVEQRDTEKYPERMIQGEIAVFYDHHEDHFVSGKIAFNGSHTNYDALSIELMNGSSVVLSSLKPMENGVFRVPLDWSKNPVSIRVSAPGYHSQVIYFKNHYSLQDMTITLYEERVLMGKVVSGRR